MHALSFAFKYLNNSPIVLLPEPDKPVKNKAMPCLCGNGLALRSSLMTSGAENQAGISSPVSKRRLTSVPDILRTLGFDAVNKKFDVKRKK